jgi:hypothetical protein
MEVFWMPGFDHNVEQAKMAWIYYFKGDRTIAFDPASRSWVRVGGQPTTDGHDAELGGLSGRALDRIARVQDGERRNMISHDTAEAEILQIIREES